jgi:hypothetical protein
MVTLPAVEDWRDGDHRILEAGRENLKMVLTWLGGDKLAGNPKPVTVMKAVLDRFKRMSQGDVRALVPIFLDDLLLPDAVKLLQDHHDAGTRHWKEAYDYARELMKGSDGATVEGRWSEFVEKLPQLSDAEHRVARERAAARVPRSSEARAAAPAQAAPSAVVSGNRDVSVVGSVIGSGTVSNGAVVDPAKLVAEVTKNVLGAI